MITPSSTKKPVAIDRIDPFHRVLLENRSLTTGLLEQLTGSVIAINPCTLVLGTSAIRCTVLSGAGVVYVLARSVVNLSLLPAAAITEVLQGEIPLGRIFARHVRENQRCNFSYFTVANERLIPIMDGRLPDPSPAARRLENKRQEVREFPGRSYDILASDKRVAHIEEIFSPRIREKADDSFGAFPLCLDGI